MSSSTLATPTPEASEASNPFVGLMNDREVEEYTGGVVKSSTLRWWRHVDDGRGPKWFRLGERRVFYRRADVVAWLAEHYAGAL